VDLAVVALHLGALHPAEKVLTLLLAFGPFLVLGLVVAVRRRREAAEAAEAPGGAAEAPEPARPQGDR
jgi:hypothetical protein